MKKIILVLLALLLSASLASGASSGLQLQKGWNLVPKTYITSGCANQARLIFDYSPLDNKYYGGLGLDITGMTDPRFQERVQFGEKYKGYSQQEYYSPNGANPGGNSMWMYLNANCQITEQRQEAEGVLLKLDRKILPGWNFLAITKKWVGLTPATIFENCTVQKIYGWSNTTQAWINTSGIQMGQDFGPEDIDQTVVAKVSGGCTLSAGSATQPPGLP